MTPCQCLSIKMNRPALLHLCPEHTNRLLIFLVLVLSNGQLLLESRRPVGDYLQVLLKENLFLGCFFEGLEEIVSFLSYFGKRDSELCDDRGEHMRVEGLVFERIPVWCWRVRQRLGIQLMLKLEGQVD